MYVIRTISLNFNLMHHYVWGVDKIRTISAFEFG